MELRYLVTEELERTSDGEEKRMFGILLTGEEGEALARLPSLFGSRERAEQYAELFTRLSLSPTHLHEVADDLLAE